MHKNMARLLIVSSWIMEYKTFKSALFHSFWIVLVNSNITALLIIFPAGSSALSAS